MTQHEEIQELLGVYALDAVEPDEASLVERHLEVCQRCRAEVAAHREVAGLLGYAGQEAPAGLWDRIAASTQETPPALRMPSLGAVQSRAEEEREQPSDPKGGRPGWRVLRGNAPVGPSASRRVRRPRALAALATAAAIAVGVLSWQVVRLDHRVTVVNNREAASAPSMATVDAALREPGARQVELKNPTSDQATLEAVILPGGAGYVYGGHMTPLPSDETYQLWGVVGKQVISYGLLGSDPAVVPFRAGKGLQDLAVTAEEAGGVARTTHAPVAAGPVSPTLA